MIEFETKFLDKSYLETRLRDFKAVRDKKVVFHIKESDRQDSNSLYIFFRVGKKDCSAMRVSDHIANSPYSQFIVAEKVLTKKKKQAFVKMVEKCIKKAEAKHLELALRWVGNEKT